ncbi:MAG TPA: ATP-binding protein [Steroidobacter sp.]|uniref:sensor histidine kinase n=1 Tax=Steroidobacter sp. TaxID=1978227 RepID=UPI002ED9D413
MPDTDVSWFSGDQFLPHGHSYMWTPGILWMHAIADILVAIAYFAIPFVLLHVARRRRDLPSNRLLIALGIFIVLCGLTRLVAVWNIWHTAYWLEGVVKAATALAAIPTGILLWRSLPSILSVPSRRQLRDANESLARANRELEAFTASVSHDLRSPLTTIAGQAGLLELSMPNATEDQRRRLTRIQGSVKQMSELIDALLVLSRISRHTLHREIIDVTALAESIILDLRQKEPARSVDVEIQPGMTVHGDRRLINDLFINLLANAWKFTSRTEHARIEVGQSLHGSMATLFIKDNGAGFDMAHEQKLFKPFQRLHGAADFEGTGVGLATVARIIDRHGGRIWAEGKPGDGAIFYFTLPMMPITEQFLVMQRALA